MLSLVAPKTEFDAPTPLYAFLSAPLAYTATKIYKFVNRLRPFKVRSRNPIRVVCISDTHTQISDVPDGDLLIHAGDLTNAGSVPELQAQIDWLAALPHTEKVAIAGNHDTWLDPRSRKTLSEQHSNGRLEWKGIRYLQHSSVVLAFPKSSRTLKVYGAPQIPACGGPEFAFQYARHQDAWTDTVPDDTDILVTHTPPRWHLDLPVGLGCDFLLRESWRVRPRLHVFGHVHAGCGFETVWWDDCQMAYERIRQRCSTHSSSLWIFSNWLDLVTLCWSGLFEIGRALLWRSKANGGMLVNSAVMNQATGRLENTIQVVEV